MAAIRIVQQPEAGQQTVAGYRPRQPSVGVVYKRYIEGKQNSGQYNGIALLSGEQCAPPSSLIKQCKKNTAPLRQDTLTMSEELYRGKVTFVNHEKHYLTIEYTHKNKVKNINFQTGQNEKKVLLASGKAHKFRVGDEINFEIKLTDRGDRMNAYNIQFLYNTALERLVNRARTHNAFKGYMKLVDENWYVKEVESYLFFPLQLGKWEKLPEDDHVIFSLTNLDKPNSIAAELQQSDFIPEYRTALKLWKTGTPVEATVSGISPYGVHVDVVGDKVQAKLPLEGNQALQVGDKVALKITYLSKIKIAVEKL